MGKFTNLYNTACCERTAFLATAGVPWSLLRAFLLSLLSNYKDSFTSGKVLSPRAKSQASKSVGCLSLPVLASRPLLFTVAIPFNQNCSQGAPYTFPSSPSTLSNVLSFYLCPTCELLSSGQGQVSTAQSPGRLQQDYLLPLILHCSASTASPLTRN